MAIDITSAEGQALVRKLAAEVDVVIENYKVGGLAKYGLDYDSLKAVNPVWFTAQSPVLVRTAPINSGPVMTL